MIDISKKQIQSCDALGKSPFDLLPLLPRDRPRQQIVRKNALCSLLVSVDRKRDSLMQKGEVRRLLALAQLLRRQLEQRFVETLIVRAWASRSLEHLVVGQIELVVTKWRLQKGLDSPRDRGQAMRNIARSWVQTGHPKDFMRCGEPSPINILYWGD
jgi:hypothetical protein